MQAWAVLRTQPHREAFASLAVRAQGVDTYVPRLPCQSGQGAAPPLFPSYLFACVTSRSDDLLRIRSAPGIAYVLPRLGPPALLPDSLIEAIRAREAEGFHERSQGQFQPGDHVVVRSGPLKSIEAIFDRHLSASGRVRILLDLVHGCVPAQIDASELMSVAAR